MVRKKSYQLMKNIGTEGESAHQTQEVRLSRSSPATAEVALTGTFSPARGDAGTPVTHQFSVLSRAGRGPGQKYPAP